MQKKEKGSLPSNTVVINGTKAITKDEGLTKCLCGTMNNAHNACINFASWIS